MSNLSSNALPSPPSEINLIELFHTIWKQKVLILGFVVLAGAIGTIITFSIPREFQVSSLLRPTAINELDALNRSQVYTLPPTEALNKVGARLDSYEARFDFFKANPELFKPFNKPDQSLEQGFEAFNRNSISLVLPDPKKTELSSYIRLDMRYPEGVDGVAITNGFVDYALALERVQVGADLKVIVDNRLAEVKGKISAARSSYDTGKESKIAEFIERDNVKRAQLKDELAGLRFQMSVVRSNRLAELTEAISIAKVMGIKLPTTPSSIASSSGDSSGRGMRTEVNNRAIPLYFMGTDALEAEVATLRRRSNDDFTNGRIAEIGKELKMLESNREVEILNQRKNEDIFIQNIDPLRAENARLRNINTDMSNLKLVSVDRRAQEPIGPTRQFRTSIIPLSLFFGLILGVLIALARQAILNRQDVLSPRTLRRPEVQVQQGDFLSKT